MGFGLQASQPQRLHYHVCISSALVWKWCSNLSWMRTHAECCASLENNVTGLLLTVAFTSWKWRDLIVTFLDVFVYFFVKVLQYDVWLRPIDFYFRLSKYLLKCFLFTNSVIIILFTIAVRLAALRWGFFANLLCHVPSNVVRDN